MQEVQEIQEVQEVQDARQAGDGRNRRARHGVSRKAECGLMGRGVSRWVWCCR